MGVSKKCVLRSTSNPNMMWIVGKEGQLSIGDDGLFKFRFVDDDGDLKLLQSGIQQSLGSLEHPASKEISFETKNSVYVFDKVELEHGLWSAEREQLESPAEISYEDYNSLRKTVDGLRRGDNQKLTLFEQSEVKRKWDNINRAVQEGRTTILPPGQNVEARPEKIPYEQYNNLRANVAELRAGKNPFGLSEIEKEQYLQKWDKLNKDIKDGKIEIVPTKERYVSGFSNFER